MDSAFAKLARAKVHRDHFFAEVATFDGTEPHSWSFHEIEHPNPALARYEVRVSVRHKLPDDWGLIIGDALTNLRAALDYALFSHVVARRILTEKEESKLQYPITTDSSNWLGAPAVPATAAAPLQKKMESKRDKLAPLVSAKVLDVIEQSQPYNNTRYGPLADPLNVLNALVNRDKHRRIQLVEWVNQELTVRHSTFEVVETDVSQTVIADGAVIARVTVKRGIAFPWQSTALRGGTFDVLCAYGPMIQTPDGSYVSAKTVLRILARDVSKVLHNLKRAGC